MATITDNGLILRSHLLWDDTSGNITYIALGTSNQAEANGDSALIAEIGTSGCARAAISSRTYEATAKAVLVHTFTVTGTVGVNEIGYLDSSANGILYMRHVFAAQKNLINGDTLQITGKETSSRA